MRRDGFTLIEMIIVVVMIGVIAVIGFPKIRRALDQTNVRSTRVFLSTAVATARAAAVQRGCRTAVHFANGSGTVWVTACSRANPALIDTIGGVANLASLPSTFIATRAREIICSAAPTRRSPHISRSMAATPGLQILDRRRIRVISSIPASRVPTTTCCASG